MTDRVRANTLQRKCTQCGMWRSVALSYLSPRGRVCLRCQEQRRKVQVRHLHVQQTYGLTIEQYETLKRHNNGRCHGCNQPRKGNLCVDHDHKTGLVRGLLCRRCNRTAGLMRDDYDALEGLAEYLFRPPADVLGITVKVDPAKAERPRRGRRRVFQG